MQQVQQVQRVQHGGAVAVSERDATVSLSIRDCCTHAPQPRSATRKSKAPDPWPPLEFSLPNLDELERISRGEIEAPQEHYDPPDDTQAGRLARLTRGAEV